MPGNQYDNKVCRECQQTKHYTEFYVKNKITKRRDVLCKQCRCKVIKEGYDPHTASDRYLKSKYGLSISERKSMWEDQKGLCAICGKPGDGRWKQLCVDHCHETGRVRKLLCRNCNMVLGQVNDDPDLLIKMSNYLTQWKEHALLQE